MKKIRDLYFSLYSEAVKNNHFLIWCRYFKNTSYPGPNFDRYLHPVHHCEHIQYLDPLWYVDSVWRDIVKFESTRKLFDYITENDLSPFKKWSSYEEDLRACPSITRNLIAKFFGRILIHNEYNPYLSLQSFEKTFAELEAFFLNDTFSYKILVNLYGPIGEINNIILDKVSIKRADYEMSKLFCFHYPGSGSFNFEMLENDYYLEFERKVLKTDWGKFVNDDIHAVQNYFNYLILSSTGNIELGNVMTVCSCWPLMETERFEVYPMKYNKYGKTNIFRYEINETTNSLIEQNYAELREIDFNKLDEHIKASLKRLKKSKATTDIEDKIIELVLSIEYLINTQLYEVTLQLCLKMIKLFDETNQDETLFKILKDFFVLRGNVVHGNKKVDSSIGNIEIINKVEKMTLRILVRYITLNQKYSYKEINGAIDKSLYLEKKIDQLLKESRDA